ncbi:M48 family metallopeptidase [Brevundimonas aveniformis]|uniref:M48 family metallopeptidase n=1 Tax=Brevundimonas aveniformis TaxID=370977 RepID=UPI0003FA53E7|nr:SprT family zinc-dependent metalloprotease [Brevundimonas aveniformis]
MGVVRIGQTEVAYDLRRSAAASERRITVTPGHVEVLALTTDGDADIDAFVNRKRQWLFNTLRELETRTAARAVVPRFMTGSKIPFRGRMAKLTVRRHDGAHVEIDYRRGFFIDLPSWVRDEDQDAVVSTELKLWLKRRARRDVFEVASSYRRRFDLKPRSLRVGEMKHGWGSCGPTGAILINWTLVFAPKAVLEYVVVHELAHLKERSHGPAFWAHLGDLLPDYERPKAWLDRHQGALDDGFLRAGR